MVDEVEPSVNKAIDGKLKLPTVIDNSFGAGWVVPDGEQMLADLPRNAFNETHSGLTVTIASGEGFVGGNWVDRDTSTDVTVPDDATSIIYAGKNHLQNNSVIIGLSGDFNAEDPKMELYEVTASGGSIDSVNDLRNIGLATGFSLSDLLGVLGVDEMVKKTGGYSSETANRLIFDLSNNKIVWDTGAGLVTLGLAPGEISLSELKSKKHSELTDVKPGQHQPKTDFVGIDYIRDSWETDNGSVDTVIDYSATIPTDAIVGEFNINADRYVNNIHLHPPSESSRQVLANTFNWTAFMARLEDGKVQFKANMTDLNQAVRLMLTGYWI